MIINIEWVDNSLKIIDQTKLPGTLAIRKLSGVEEVFEAIQRLRIRGAPALGIAEAFGLYLGLRHKKPTTRTDFFIQARSLASYLSGSRPTAVNLQWALQEILDSISRSKEADPQHLLNLVLEQAQLLLQDDINRCKKISQHGIELFKNRLTVLTHCNTGALATAGMGTALGIIFNAAQQGKIDKVLVDETRPLLQGARLTMWELEYHKIPALLISDNMAAYAMQREMVDLVLVGADRIAANGDVANKIGTYSLAILAEYHKIPFYVAAPLSSFDRSIPSGEFIPIEERDPTEVTRIWNKLEISVPGAKSWNPAFDVTPAKFISGLITEQGILFPPFEKSIKQLNYPMYQNQEELKQ
jgi:methylthioribose-1-phosphate isomerase